MQIKVNNHSESFKAIEVTLTIETRKELESIICLGNVSSSKICEMVNDYQPSKINRTFSAEDVWHIRDFYYKLNELL